MVGNTVKIFSEPRPAISIQRTLVAVIICSTCLVIFQSYGIQKKNSLKCSWKTPIENKILDFCPITPPNLIGRFEPDISNETLETVEYRLGSLLQPGGYYKPKECIARDRVAILVTCRDREYQLPIFLKNLHPLLMRQQLEYQIFVITQIHGFWFNKGALYNVGFVEATKINQNWDCVIFHDIDMVPMDDRNIYDCPRVNPRHMCIDLDKFNYKLLYESIFGGVSAMTVSLYQQLNGHSNSYWGWGGEDSDMWNRIEKAGYYVERYPHQITPYKSLAHNGSLYNPDWEKIVEDGKARFKIDGLNSLKYHVKKIDFNKTFTRIVVDIIPEEMRADSEKYREPNITNTNNTNN